MSSTPFEESPESASPEKTESSMNSNNTPDRKEVFHLLVSLQDGGETVEASRARVAAQFEITHEALMDIEREGVSKSWPPL